jgi:ABC-type transport system substrate-binding protein
MRRGNGGVLMDGTWAGRVAAVVGIMAVCAGGLAGCSGLDSDARPAGPTTPVAAPKPGGRIVFGLEADPNGLDPTRNAWDPSGLQLANALYDPIAAIDADGVAQPYLVESFTPAPDYKRWTFKLRPGITFSNGDPLDAPALAEFVNALRKSAITGPPTQMISELKVVDPLTVDMFTSRPWATLPVHLAGQGGYVVSPKQIADTEGTSKPIGTGPFTLTHWDIDKKFELVRNPRYWREGLPYLDGIDFVVVPDGRDRVAMLERGEMDATSLTQLWDLKALDEAVVRNRAGSRLQVENDNGDAEKTSIMFNALKPPLNDVRVRRAIAHATDVPGLAARNGWPLASLAQGPVSPESPFFSPAPYPAFDPAEARRLIQDYLKDTKVRPRPKEVAFTVTAPDFGAELMNQLVAQWAQVGIKARLDYTDVKQTVRQAVLGNFDAMLFRYFAAADFDLLWHFFVDDTIATEGISINFGRLRNKDITTGMNEARATLDAGTRKQAYARVQNAFADQMPYLWMQRSEWRLASTARVRDAHNVTLPDGRPARPLNAGTLRLVQTWVDR